MPKFFKRWAPKAQPRFFKKEDRFRGSAQDRGYDWAWQRLSGAYRKDHPFCEECDHWGRVEPMVYVDHMVPIRIDPEKRLDPENIWSLCARCHHQFKFRLERYAETAHQTQHLQDWCRKPETRPKAFREDLKRIT